MQEAQILICATDRDIPWLNASLLSIQKFWSGNPYPLIVIEPQSRNKIPPVAVQLKSYVVFHPKEMHQYVRMMADCYVSAPIVIFMDVHDMLIRPCDLSTFTDSNRRPTCAMEKYTPHLSRNGIDENCVCNRRAIIEDLTGIEPQYEYSICDPMIVYRHSIRRLRESIELKNRRPLRDLMQNYVHISDYWSEYNFFGSYCYAKENSSYNWTSDINGFKPPIRQFTGVTDPTKGCDYEAIQAILQ